MDTSGGPAAVAESWSINQASALRLPDHGEIQRIAGESKATGVVVGAVKGLKAAAVYQLTGKYFTIIIICGHSR